MTLRLAPPAREACRNAIVLSGCARSGTTILGQLLHSMERVEYRFEGPTLVSLFALIDKVPREEWMLLYETYLFQDVLIDSLAGRGLNCNREDDSSIYKVKAASLIESRLARSKRMVEALAEARHSVIACKIPDIVPLLRTFVSYYPDSRLVLIYRDANDTLNSLLQKRWFADETLQEELSIWPNSIREGKAVPYWVSDEDIDQWLRANELSRAAYYYVRMVGSFAHLPGAMIVSYDLMLEKPVETIGRLAETLGLTFGPKTSELTKTIRKTDVPRIDALGMLDSGMRDRLHALDELYK